MMKCFVTRSACSGFKHVIALCIICYLLTVFTPVDHVHRAVFLFSMGYLSWIHMYRYLFVHTYVIDITG